MSNIPYRDDRAALQARIEELESELDHVRKELERVQREASADVLRARVEKLESVLAGVVKVRIMCTGFEEDGPLLSWKFYIENNGVAPLRLRDGSTTWLLRSNAPGREPDIPLLEAEEEREFGDRSVLHPGSRSDEYRIRLDLSSEPMRTAIERRRSTPRLYDRIAPCLRVSFECSSFEFAGFVEGFLER